MRGAFVSVGLGCLALASACAGQDDGDGAGGQSGTSHGGAGGHSTGGAGGLTSGGATTGGSSGATIGGTGGTTMGGNGAGGSPSSSTGGFPDPFEGYPDWVQGCLASRHLAQCPSCLTPECIVCTYGTDAEIAETESTCTETPDAYAFYCDCVGCDNSAGGVCRYP